MAFLRSRVSRVGKEVPENASQGGTEAREVNGRVEKIECGGSATKKKWRNNKEKVMSKKK